VLIMELRFDCSGVGWLGQCFEQCAGAATGATASAGNDQEIQSVVEEHGRPLATNLYGERANSATTSFPQIPTPSSAAEPATGRVVVIAPTRADCETIEPGHGLAIDTPHCSPGSHGEDTGGSRPRGGGSESCRYRHREALAIRSSRDHPAAPLKVEGVNRGR